MEIWKDVKGYEGLYRVSNLGNVLRIGKSKLMAKTKSGHEYYSLNLCMNGKIKRHYIHRLMAITFLSNPENKPQVNHINGIKADNHLHNLEWASRSENMTHAYQNGLMAADQNKGVKNGQAKLNIKEVLAIRNMKHTDISQIRIAKIYGVVQATVSNIISRKIWDHI